DSDKLQLYLCDDLKRKFSFFLQRLNTTKSNKPVSVYGIFYYFDRMKRHMFIRLRCIQSLQKKREFSFQIITKIQLEQKKNERNLWIFFASVISHLANMSFRAFVCIENKISEVTFASLSLKSLGDKVKELINNRTDLKAENPFNFKIVDINDQSIDNDQKLRSAFDTDPVCFFVHFIDRNNDKEMKYPNDEKRDIENIELDQNKPWNEANKVAHTIVEQMVEKKRNGIVIVSTSLDQLARPNDRWFFQNIPFTMMINSHKYMKEKKVISPYVVYSFHSENITFDNVTIDGCVYVIDCVINGIGHFHITQHLIHTRQSVIHYTFQQHVFTVLLPIDSNKFMKSGIDLYEKSNFDEAISLIRFALCVRLQTRSDPDIDIAHAFYWLGKVYNEKGEFDKSIEYHKKALTIRLDKLEPDHIDIGESYNMLGIAHDNKREYDKALEFYQKTLVIWSKKLDSSHSDVADSYNNLGRVYYMKAEYDKAYKHHKKALDIYSKKSDENQIKVAICHCHLGNVHYRKGEYTKSIECHKKHSKISLGQLGKDHTNIAASFNNLGNSYFEAGEYEISIAYHEQALDILLKKFDERHAFVAISLNELGLVWIKGKMQINKAKEYVDKALEILNDDKNNSFDLELAKSYDVLGLILEKSEKYEEAIQYFEKSLEIRAKNLNDNDPYIGWSFHYLASVFKNKNDLNKSIEYGEKALKLRLNKLDHDHPHVGESYILLGDIYLARGNKTKAKKCYENAFGVFNTRFGEQHQKTVRVRLILEKVNEVWLSILFYFQQAYIIVDETKELIKLKDLTFEELIQQIYSCLNLQCLEKMQQENLKFELVDMSDNIINSDEAVQQSFMMEKPSFKILWKSIISEKYKIIKNALVVMIAISKYTDKKKYDDLSNVKDEDVKNFKQLFEQELNYTFVTNESPQMTEKDVRSFLTKFTAKYKLHDNTHKYDGLIMIICGHGENGNMLVTSDGKSLSIDGIRESFGCDILESFNDLPKIFIIDVCRGKNIPTAQATTRTRGKTQKKGNVQSLGHSGDGFLTIWSTISGYQVADFSLLSKCMKSVVISKYKSGCPFKQILDDVRRETRKSKNGEWYCVEAQDTTSYDIVFVARKKS
ncbi:hypothetical protein RFI_02778, partial [Reticulomyxa filosa]